MKHIYDITIDLSWIIGVDWSKDFITDLSSFIQTNPDPSLSNKSKAILNSFSWSTVKVFAYF